MDSRNIFYSSILAVSSNVNNINSLARISIILVEMNPAIITDKNIPISIEKTFTLLVIASALLKS